MRPFTLDGGMRNEIHDMRTVTPEMSELITAAMLIVFTLLMPSDVPMDLYM